MSNDDAGPEAVDAGEASGPPRCPFIASADSSWVADAAHAGHRCGAVRPPAPLALAKQRRLCLTASHVGCATYVAALEARQAIGISVGASAWGWVRTTPVVDVNVGRGAQLAGLLAERRVWQVVPAVALVAALGALGLSNLGSTGNRGGPTPTATFAALTGPTLAGPTATALATETGGAVLTAEPSPSPSPSAAATPSPAPSPTPAASASTSYRVKSGDTLYDIAIKFKTTSAAIMKLNNLTSNILHVGQVLLIP